MKKCPVLKCTNDTGDTPKVKFMMCKPCWRRVPKQVKDQWRAAKKAFGPKSKWNDRYDEVGKDGWSKLINDHTKSVLRCIESAYREPITKEA